ncbi:MAG: hypothetical protein VX741_08935, partial [Pseudomonadota bacterium]|nr:hypothetical protein [Pseudomonadota bacterium]
MMKAGFGRSRGFTELRRAGRALRRRINGLCAEIAARIALDARERSSDQDKSIPSPLCGRGGTRRAALGGKGLLGAVFSRTAKARPHFTILSPVGMGFIVAFLQGDGRGDKFAPGRRVASPPEPVEPASMACDDV